MISLASVVIPTYNRRDVLARCLPSLFNQTVQASDYELVVVDDGSTDGTPDLVRVLSAEAPCVVNYLRMEHGGRARACNTGILAARGPLLIILDCDMVVQPGFVAEHLTAHERPRMVVRGPVIDTARFDDPTSESAFFAMSRAFFAANSSAERQELIEAGLFDEGFTEYGWEDLELGYRLRCRGLSLRRCSSARCYHLQAPIHYENLPDLIRKERERGHMAVVYYRKHPTRHVRMSTLITPVFFAFDRLLAPFHWPEQPFGLTILQRLDKLGWRRTFQMLVAILRTHAYADGLREALAAGKGRAKDDRAY